MSGSSKTVQEIDTTETGQFFNTVARVLKEEKKKKYPFEMIRRSRAMEGPLLVMGDSYKAGHFKMYKDAVKMSAYGEFREPMELPGTNDPRIIVYGMRHIIDQLISRVITNDDVDWAKQFYGQHGIMGGKYEYPKDMFDKIRELGHFPVKIDALPDGSVVLPHTPVFFITAENEFSRFCTFLETVLTMIWYPSTVATLSKHTKCLVEDAFEHSVVGGKNSPILMSRLHDFGFRGCTCVEQSVIGGAAHLLNFDGSDTMSACFHVQYHLNGGKPIGQSIPATEHSVMTSFGTELDAIKNLIAEYPGQLIACVMDSYNYDHALEVILPEVKKIIGTGTFVIRPDSGDSVVQVLKALRAAVAAGFPQENVDVKGKKFIVLKNVAVIQGDGINYATVKEILDAVHEAGFSAINVAFGMGGGLLQKVNRDTLSFATKLSYVEFNNGTNRDVMKAPYQVPEKWSSPGLMQVMNKKGEAHHTVFPIEQVSTATTDGFKNSMVTVYDKGILDEDFMTEPFDAIRKRVSEEWDQCKTSCYRYNKWNDPRHESLTAKQKLTAGKIPVEISSYNSNDKLFDTDFLKGVTRLIAKRQTLVEERKEEKRVKESQVMLGRINEQNASIEQGLNEAEDARRRVGTLAGEFSGSDLQYPLMRLNNLLDSLSSKLEN